MDVAAYAAMAAAANPMPLVNVPAPSEGLVVHVDGDFCAYACAGNDETGAGQARRKLLDRLDGIKHASGAGRAVMHITDPSSTKAGRYYAATVKPYQAQRKGARRPKNWATLREFIEGYDGPQFRTKNWINREADDGIAYVAHHAAQSGNLAAICTKDKDMRMLPGRHVVWDTLHLVDVPFGCFELVAHGLTYGHKWFWLQMLQGDAADHIPGLPKYINDKGKPTLCGEKTAEKLLAGVHCNNDAFDAVAELYQGFYEDEWSDRLAEQASLLWLRTDRHADIGDFGQIMPHSSVMSGAIDRLRERVNECYIRDGIEP